MEDLISKQLVLVTGKGGIGKTLFSTALGLLAAKKNKNTLIIENTAQSQIAPLFGKNAEIGNVIELTAKLSVVNVNGPNNLKEYVTKYLGQKMLYDKVFDTSIVRALFNNMPGFYDLMMLGRIYYTCELGERKPDLVIFDGPASGHFYGLLTTPQVVEESRVGGPLAFETNRITKFLSNKDRCTIAYVATPEDLVVSESLEFIPKLAENAVAHISTAVINRIFHKLENSKHDSETFGSYFKKMSERSEKATQNLLAGIDKINRDGGRNITVKMLPELGFIPEPISPEIYLDLFRNCL